MGFEIADLAFGGEDAKSQPDLPVAEHGTLQTVDAVLERGDAVGQALLMHQVDRAPDHHSGEFMSLASARRSALHECATSPR